MRKIGVAAIGNTLDINTWSNIPYFFYTTGNKLGVFNEPWQLNLSAFKISRVYWNVLQVIKGRGFGGYQFSNDFLNKAEQSIPQNYFSSTVISFNQLFPRVEPIIKNGGRIYYFIDCTLYDLFNQTEYEISIPDKLKREAINNEKINYKNAAGVVVMGRWVKETLENYYQIPENKIHHILPAANISVIKEPVNTDSKLTPGIDRELILGFVGKDWRRKGLPILIEVMQVLKAKGYKVRVKIIGNCPDVFTNLSEVEFLGFVDKSTNSSFFIEQIEQCDLGCLFSLSEALGFSILEFLRLGVPVIGYYHQGLLDTLFEDASIRCNLNEGVYEIANSIEQFIINKDYRISLKEAAINRSKYFSWERVINDWKKILDAN